MKARELRADFAVFLHSPSGGGAQRRTVTLVNGFVARGYEVDLVMVTASGALTSEIDPRVRIVELTSWAEGHAMAKLPRRVQLFLAAPLLARYLLKRPAPVLMSAASHVHLPVLVAKRLARSSIPVVLRLSNHLTRTRADGTRPEKRPFATYFAKKLYLDASGAIAVSKGVADDIVEAIGFPADKVTTIYNPIRADELRRRAEEPLEHPWFAPGEPPVVLGVGRIVKQKDFPTLVRAFARVRAERPVRLVILGRSRDETRRRSVLDLAASLGVAGDVDLAGYVDNPAPYMRHAGLVALSSAWEGLPGVLLEALACGCPVVSTDCPSGPREILLGGKVGPLVPVGDDVALAKAMLATLAAPPERAMLEARADDFSEAKAVDAYVDYLRSVARRAGFLEESP